MLTNHFKLAGAAAFVLAVAALLCSAQPAVAQSLTVHGVVVDTQEPPLPVIGATVYVKGTKQGTTADAVGSFSIQAKKGDILVLLKMKDKADEDPTKYDFIVTNYRNHFVGSEVSLSFVDEIPVLPSGKEDYCVSEFEYEG